MPCEIRLILFEPGGVADALHRFLVGRRELGPDEHVVVAEVASTPPITVDLVILRGMAQHKRTCLDLEVAAAMIMHCLKRGIPLPHKTQKFLKPVAGGIGFSQGIGPRDFDLVVHEDELASPDQPSSRPTGMW